MPLSCCGFTPPLDSPQHLQETLQHRKTPPDFIKHIWVIMAKSSHDIPLPQKPVNQLLTTPLGAAHSNSLGDQEDDNTATAKALSLSESCSEANAPPGCWATCWALLFDLALLLQRFQQQLSRSLYQRVLLPKDSVPSIATEAQQDLAFWKRQVLGLSPGSSSLWVMLCGWRLECMVTELKFLCSCPKKHIGEMDQ